MSELQFDRAHGEDATIQLSRVSLDVPIRLVNSRRRSGDWLQVLVASLLERPERRFTRILNNISLTIRKGDRLGIIGRNGAGKTTLLHVLTGAYTPTVGSIEVTGRRKALMNISMGFNPNATVYENIFLRCIALGMTSAQTGQYVDDIISFSGLEAKLGVPLATLSSGQRMRLAFSISTALPSEIIIMDEWIGTGDAQFMERAKKRLLDRLEGTQIVILATHNNKIMRDVCNRAIVMSGGSIVFDGKVEEALLRYSAGQSE